MIVAKIGRGGRGREWPTAADIGTLITRRGIPLRRLIGLACLSERVRLKRLLAQFSV